MRCPECIAEGERSRLTSGGGMTTLLGYRPYYDEDGVYHDHDPNTTTTGYSCSRGHKFTIRTKRSCPNCTYGHDDD